MAGKTRLYQPARSPLIQGHSKTERSLWQSWFGGTTLACVASGLVIQVLGGSVTSPEALRSTDLGVVLGAALGAYAGAIIARAWGFRVRWGIATAFGLVGVAIAAAVLRNLW
ncbi:MAG: hypothetical protein WC971_09960 [Coriobacteriia bacterium]